MTKFVLRPWEPDSSFHVKTHPALSLKKKSIPILQAGSHMGENLKTDFQPNFHPKSQHDWEPGHPMRTTQHWVFEF
jgi:hypothetical protein